jgi:adenylate cyclase
LTEPSVDRSTADSWRLRPSADAWPPGILVATATWIGWLAVAPGIGFPRVAPAMMLQRVIPGSGRTLGWIVLVAGLIAVGFGYAIATKRGIAGGVATGAAYGVLLWLLSGAVLMPLMELLEPASGAVSPPLADMAMNAEETSRTSFMMLHRGALAPAGAFLAWLLFGSILGMTARAAGRGRSVSNIRHAASSPSDSIVPMDERWRAILSGDSTLAVAPRVGRRCLAFVPGSPRCKFCNAPFRGRYATVLGRIGYTPSRKNPSVCARCMERAPEGGALVPVTILFADVRGYTTLAEHISSVEATALLNRFYQAASDALLPHGAVLGQIAGDEVMALFVPGLAGPRYPKKAMDGAVALLHAVGYGVTGGNWLEVGVGLCSGEQFVGNVGGGGFKDFTSLGDVTNTAARLQAVAGSGEIVLCGRTYRSVADRYPFATIEHLELKGKRDPIEAYRILPDTQDAPGRRVPSGFRSDARGADSIEAGRRRT